MSDLHELSLIRSLVRGQVHRVNNTLTTLEFAIAAYVPQAQRAELKSLVNEVVADLADLRTVASPTVNARQMRDDVGSVVETAVRLVANSPMKTPPIKPTCPDNVLIGAEDSWTLIRLLSGLLSLADRDCCSEVEVAVTDINEIEFMFLGCDKAIVSKSSGTFDFVKQLASELHGTITTEICDNGLMIRLSPKSTKPLVDVDLQTQAKEESRSLEKLLIVEDSPTLQVLYQRQYASLGLQVMVAASHSEARQLLSDFEPCLVLIDAQLGDESGTDLALELARDRGLPTIVMSGDVTGEFTDKLSGYVVGFLQKPFTPTQLFKVFGCEKTEATS